MSNIYTVYTFKNNLEIFLDMAAEKIKKYNMTKNF